MVQRRIPADRSDRPAGRPGLAGSSPGPARRCRWCTRPGRWWPRSARPARSTGSGGWRGTGRRWCGGNRSAFEYPGGAGRPPRPSPGGSRPARNRRSPGRCSRRRRRRRRTSRPGGLRTTAGEPPAGSPAAAPGYLSAATASGPTACGAAGTQVAAKEVQATLSVEEAHDAIFLTGLRRTRAADSPAGATLVPRRNIYQPV